MTEKQIVNILGPSEHIADGLPAVRDATASSPMWMHLVAWKTDEGIIVVAIDPHGKVAAKELYPNSMLNHYWQKIIQDMLKKP